MFDPLQFALLRSKEKEVEEDGMQKNSSHFPTCPVIIMFKFKDITKFSSFTFIVVVDKDIIYF